MGVIMIEYDIGMYENRIKLQEGVIERVDMITHIVVHQKQ
jgi:hypothetical protein